MPIRFLERRSVERVEESADLAPKFNERGLLTAVTTDTTKVFDPKEVYGDARNPTVL